VKELGFDREPIDALKRLAPNGINVYNDNVGAEQLDAALEHINDFGGIVCCGDDRRGQRKNAMSWKT
jgi:NADPH-dependent curcumin reductase CurA